MFDHIALPSKAQSKVSLWYWLMEEGLEALLVYLDTRQEQQASQVCLLSSSRMFFPAFSLRGVGL